MKGVLLLARACCSWLLQQLPASVVVSRADVYVGATIEKFETRWSVKARPAHEN